MLRCVLKGYVKDIYYARFHTRSYHRCRKKIFHIKINKVNSQEHMKYRSRSTGQGDVKGMSRTITMQGFTLAAITDAEKTKL